MKKLIPILGLAAIFGLLSIWGLYKYVHGQLPKIITVEDYEPLLVSQVYDRNGKKVGEFWRQRRILIPYKEIPKHLINAFLAAEDDQFFKHQGINLIAITRAAIANMRAGHTVQGGSTITQQVAKTFFLTPEKNIIRKAKEAMLALELEEHLSKEDILYLYLNQIFFGNKSYGIGTAAETYFRKPVQKLTLAEIAILAGLPKAPSAYSPVSNPSRAKERQMYVLRRMVDIGAITQAEADTAGREPVKVYLKENFQDYAPFYLETVRQMLIAELGEETVSDKGIKVYTALDLPRQLAAQEAAERGLKELDKRQGFRGPLKNVTEPKEVGEFLMRTRNKLITETIPERTIQADGTFIDYGPLDLQYDIKKGLPFYLKIGKSTEGIVSKVDDELGLVWVRIAEVEGLIDFDTMQWARKPNGEKRFDLDQIKKPSEALKTGDIVLMKIVGEKFGSIRLNKLLAARKEKSSKPFDINKYIGVELDQTPIAEAALLSIDQDTSEIVAMVGGYNFERNQFNRALQAARQTGSSFKSVVYASALDKGYTPSTPIMDAPLVFDESQKTEGNEQEGQDEDTKIWKPSNHGKSFGGDIIFRNALVKSLNVPAVKIVEDLTIPWATEYAKRLGIFSPLNPDFTMVLGSSSVTLYEMTKVFAEFGNLGKRVRPILIRKVTDNKNKVLLEKVLLEKRFEKETEPIEKEFEEKRLAYLEKLDKGETLPDPKKSIEPHIFFKDPDQLIKPSTAYLITSLLRAVVEDKHGTGVRARALGREVAGKTGTTNGYYDAWFLGYTAQFATGVWVGFDQERTLGKGEVGGRAALPIWIDYMKAAHEDLPQVTFPVPEGIVFANIDSDTGHLASSSSKNIVRQAYLEGTEPTSARNKEEEDTDFYKQDLSE